MEDTRTDTFIAKSSEFFTNEGDGQCVGIKRGTAGWWQDLSDLQTNVSGRPGLSSQEYGYYRPDEAIPTKIRDIIRKSDIIYRRVGLIRNIVDLMSDFACQGIRVVHPNKNIEKVARAWWNKGANGTHTSERFLNILYRLANVVVRRINAKLTLKDVTNQLKSIAAEVPEIDIQRVNTSKRVIPWNYVFIDPTCLEIAGGSLSSFTRTPSFSIRLNESLKRIIRSPSTKEEKEIVAKLPSEIKLAATTNNTIPLPMDKTRVFYYKKDDWQPWAFPMIYSIMEDIVLYEKLKLADKAALDGAISNIRIFKLGSLEHKIPPLPAAASKLTEILESHTGAGTMDLIWGPDIELVESKTQVHQFLGDEKYAGVLQSIYAAMGVPATLTGTSGGTGTTNNYISLQTLIQRLDYGRGVLKSFWEHEFHLLQEAMGWRVPPKIEFEYSDLGDPASEKALLIQLADRNLISDELLRYRFGHDPDMEVIRTNREHRDRNNKKLVPKAGAFHDPQFEIALKKVFTQTGAVTPSQVGLDLPKPKKGEKNAIEIKAASMPKPIGGTPPKKKGVSGQGRPKNSNDTTKRKTKKFTPKVKAALEIWASDAQDKISESITPLYLEHINKKNLRTLTSSEFNELEKIKFNLLCTFKPFAQIDNEIIYNGLNVNPDINIYKQYKEWVNTIASELDRKLNTDELRQIQQTFYITLNEDQDNE